jgi:hypothetical protein
LFSVLEEEAGVGTPRMLFKEYHGIDLQGSFYQSGWEESGGTPQSTEFTPGIRKPLMVSSQLSLVT